MHLCGIGNTHVSCQTPLIMSQEIEILPDIISETTQEIEKSSVPWTILDVGLFFFLWLAAQIAIGIVIGIVMVFTAGSPARLQTQTAIGGEGYQHPIVQMIQKGKDEPIVLFVAFVSVVVVAPLIEEFLFRLLLQGWLHAKLLLFRVPCAAGIAMTVTSLGFALIHAGDSGNIGVWPLFFLFFVSSMINLMIFIFGIVYLILVRKAKMTQWLFGTVPFFRSGFFTVAGYCLLVVVFCQGLGVILGLMFENMNVSPIPIFFFSLALGALYSKTKNLLYCILLHACLNAVALVLVLFMV